MSNTEANTNAFRSGNDYAHTADALMTPDPGKTEPRDVDIAQAQVYALLAVAFETWKADHR